MIQITEATAIALHTMVYFANRENNVISLKEISEAFKISDNHLSKVLQRLVKSGFLNSIKGPKGGFILLPEKKDATYMSVYEAIEGKWQVHTCLFASKQANCDNCIMGGLVSGINNQFEDFMTGHRISEFKL